MRDNVLTTKFCLEFVFEYDESNLFSMTAKITPKSKEHLGSQYHPRPQTVHRVYSFPVRGITAAFTNEDRDHPKLSCRLRIWTSTNLRQLSRTLMIQTELLILLNSKTFNAQLTILIVTASVY